MAENTATDNQATKPTPSTPLAPAPDLGDGPWDMSTGINNPNNQRDYTREPKGTINTNGGLLGVMGNVFDKLMELLARLFGNLIGKDTESIADQKADAEFRSDSIKFARDEYEKGKDRASNHYEVNKSLNIPEYANKDIASEYLMFTRFGNNKLLFTDRDQKNGAILEASLKENFMRCFSISIDQIKGYNGEKDLKNAIPFAAWMASPVYKNAFDASIDKDALLAGLSPEEKELLKQAKFKTKSERDELFKSHPGLEDKFTFVRNTALAVSNADMMATTMSIETGIQNLSVPDLRFASGKQMGSLQLTMGTALEAAEKSYTKADRISEGEAILKELRMSNERNFSAGEIKDIVEFVLKNKEYGGDRALFTTSLQKKLNEASSREEIATIIGGFSKVYGSETGYIQIQQNIMNEKMAIAINNVGGIDNFNNVMYGDNPVEKGKLLVSMVNFYKFDGGERPITAKELYEKLSGGKKAVDEKDAYRELGKMAETDSKAIFMAGYYTVYHGNKNKGTVMTALGSENVNTKTLIDNDEQRQTLALNSLSAVPAGGLNADEAEQKYYMASGVALVGPLEGKINQIHNDSAFKDFDPNEEHTAKDILARMSKANIPDDLKKVGIYEEYIKMLKESPDKKLIGSPVEHLRIMLSDKEKDFGSKYDIFEINSEVIALREDLSKFLNDSQQLAKRGVVTNYDYLNFMKSDAARAAFLDQQIKETPALKQVLDSLKEKDSILAAQRFNGFDKLVNFAKTYQEQIASNNVNDIYKKAEKDKNLAAIDQQVESQKKTDQNLHSDKGIENFDPGALKDSMNVQTLALNKKEFVELWSADQSYNHRDFLKDDKQMQLALKLYLSDDYVGMPISKNEMESVLTNYLKDSGIISNPTEAASLLEDLRNSLKKHNINPFSDPVAASKEFEDVIEAKYSGQIIDYKLAGFLISSGILSKPNFEESWLSKNVSLFGDVDDMKNIIVRMPDNSKMTYIQFGQQNEKGVFEKAEEARLAYKEDYEKNTLANNNSQGLDPKALTDVKEQANNKKEDVKVASIGI